MEQVFEMERNVASGNHEEGEMLGKFRAAAFNKIVGEIASDKLEDPCKFKLQARDPRRRPWAISHEAKRDNSASLQLELYVQYHLDCFTRSQYLKGQYCDRLGTQNGF